MKECLEEDRTIRINSSHSGSQGIVFFAEGSSGACFNLGETRTLFEGICKPASVTVAEEKGRERQQEQEQEQENPKRELNKGSIFDEQDVPAD